ncbi:hypothetical protein [Thermoactinomyces sp. DSM 45892]|uniref:hypothetical protein n=1 Tax=Thermoactinomyces sp. DSM 45892 TaxID=1882753 RepID=UPI000898186C|nr:hypothetical protein [Thermoactinomyces sp. DSM 45892]SDZ38020.1 hypothetical protein SAMN05444416_1325 [Thermoactinomyces sp. DSM 45892]
MNPVLSKIEYRLEVLQFQIETYSQGFLQGMWEDGKIAQRQEEMQFLNELKQLIGGMENESTCGL